MTDIRIKRVYDLPGPNDGFRVLVDRLWPRGLTKERVAADLWLKDAAPSTDLRKWFGHDHDKWEEFKTRYFGELDERTNAVQRLCDQAEKGPLTLLFAARDTEYNEAAVLRQYLLQRSADQPAART